MSSLKVSFIWLCMWFAAVYMKAVLCQIVAVHTHEVVFISAVVQMCVRAHTRISLHTFNTYTESIEMCWIFLPIYSM